LSDEKPVTLCAVNWIGISKEGQVMWKTAFAKAGSTKTDRVSVHALHQHEGVGFDCAVGLIDPWLKSQKSGMKMNRLLS
jgi:hypothetical protein